MKTAWRLLLFILLSLSATSSLKAQTTGYVRNEDGKSVAHAYVLVYDKGNKLLSFATTDNNGFFALGKAIIKPGRRIVIRCLGYREEQIKTDKATSTPFHVILRREEIGLKEVVVSAKPIREYNDTTQFLVSAFTDGMEKNVEEMLKKLPGIEVDNNGDIAYRGKHISKITLDHADMFGTNYKTASKTIPAKFIGTVEVIKNYQENRQLKDVQRSNDMILNLSLKSDMRLQKPVGQMEMGGGYRHRYNEVGNLLLMNKKFKLYDAMGFSNIRSSQFASFEDLIRLDSAEIVGDHLYNFAHRDNIDYAEQKSEYNSLNMVWQPKKALTISSQFNVEKNRYQTESREETSYFNNAVKIDIYTFLKNSPIWLNNNFQIKYDLCPTTTLTLLGKIVHANKKVNNKFTEDMSSAFATQTKATYVEGKINLSHAFKNKAAVIISNTTMGNRDNQSFGFNNSIYDICQNFNHQDVLNLFSIQYYKKERGWAWNVETGQNYRKERATLTHDSFDNQVKYNEHLLFTKGDITFHLGKSRIELKTLLGYWQQKLIDTSGKNTKSERMRIEPELLFEGDWGRHYLSLSCDYTQGKIMPTEYLGRYTDYREYTEPASFVNDHTGDFHINSLYRYSPSVRTSILAIYNYSLSQNNWVDAIRITENMDYILPTEVKNNRTHFGNLSVSHYIDTIRQGFKLSASINKNSFQTEYEDNGSRNVNSVSVHSTLSLRSAFSGWFNYVMGARYTFSSVSGIGSKPSRTRDYSFYQDLIGSFGKNLKVKFTFDEHFLGRNHTFYLFVRPYLSYGLPKKDITLTLTTYNIFNNKNIREYNVTAISSSEYYYKIVPTYCLLSVSFRY